MKVIAKRLEVTDLEHPMTWPYICEYLRRPTVERNITMGAPYMMFYRQTLSTAQTR